jgi:hypothetical protein
VDGHIVKPRGAIVISPNARQVRVQGMIKPGTPEMSFEQAVEDYKREYKRPYKEFLRTGVTDPHP